MRRKRKLLSKGSTAGLGERIREAQLISAANAAAQRYGHHPNVLGISAGTKYRKKTPLEQFCVQFFVKKKRRRPKSRPLPKFVYGVKDGQIDRSVKIPTDVIEVRKVHLAGGAGSRLIAFGSEGSITLFFRNRTESSESAYYVLTCSHVVGDLTCSPPVNHEIDCPDCCKVSPFGLVIKNTTSQGEYLEYDIALAKVTPKTIEALGPSALRPLDGKVDGGNVVLKSFMEANEIRPPLQVECQLLHGWRTGTIRSFAGTFLTELRGRKLRVRNLFLLDVGVVPGDSGGIVYSEDRAVGLVVAHSPEGWTWFHPFQGAVDYLASLDPRLELQCFTQ